MGRAHSRLQKPNEADVRLAGGYNGYSAKLGCVVFFSCRMVPFITRTTTDEYLMIVVGRVRVLPVVPKRP